MKKRSARVLNLSAFCQHFRGVNAILLTPQIYLGAAPKPKSHHSASLRVQARDAALYPHFSPSQTRKILLERVFYKTTLKA